MSNPFKITSFNGGGCGAIARFIYNGNEYSPQNTIKPLGLPITDRQGKWTVDNIMWAFIEPDLTDKEKEQFVEALNAYRGQAVDYCKSCCLCFSLLGEGEQKITLQSYFGTDNIEQARKIAPSTKLFCPAP